ncbi:hypothetical protein JVU11DRAFT_3677 [Chiua virens]|nr:hypothetical protein JVU11DRAFT_3677 [Chiua virens]
MIQVLVEKGANVDSPTSNGDRAVHLAISGYNESQCLQLLKIFAEVGCNLTAANSKGRTPLDCAIREGYTSVVEWLLSRDTPATREARERLEGVPNPKRSHHFPSQS